MGTPAPAAPVYGDAPLYYSSTKAKEKETPAEESRSSRILVEEVSQVEEEAATPVTTTASSTPVTKAAPVTEVEPVTTDAPVTKAALATTTASVTTVVPVTEVDLVEQPRSSEQKVVDVSGNSLTEEDAEEETQNAM